MSEDNLLSGLEDLLGEKEPPRSRFNLSTLFSIFVLNWHYFLLSIIICVCGALLYLRYTEATYRVSARLLIKDEESRKTRNVSQMLTNMMDAGDVSKSFGIQNEIEILKSRVLIRDVVKDLKLYAEYRRKGRFKDIIVYNKQPFIAELDPAHLDSLDRVFIEGGPVATIVLRLYKQDNADMVEGVVLQPQYQEETKRFDFAQKLDKSPTVIQTPVGPLTLTASPHYALKPHEEFIVTILPPMVTATKILSNFGAEQVSLETDIAVVKLTDSNIQRGMDILRHMVVCYNRQANDDKNEVALRTEEFINERLVQINAELGSTDEEIEVFKRQQAVTGLNVDAQQAVQMTNQYSTRVSEAKTQLQMLDYLCEYVNDPKNQFQIIPSNVGLTDGASTQLISSYNKSVQERNRLLTALSEDAPQVQTLTTSIRDLESSIKTALLQARRSAEITLQGIMSEFGRYQSLVTKAPLQERVLTQIGRQLNVKSGIYLLLLQKREENSIALAATADKGKLIDEPLYEGQVKPKKMFILFMAVFASFAIPFIFLFLIRLLRYKIEGHEDVQQLTEMPIISDIPLANEDIKTSAGIVVHENKNTQMDEIFRSLRTNVLFMLKEDQKTILFTSCTSGEGKTFCAANLATSFALLGKKVVLCGLDIRKPALGRLFSVSDKQQGITPLLVKEHVTQEDISGQIVNSGVNDNLDLLLAGPIPPNPAELLARKTFHQVIELLKERYDYVILDTAPIGLVTDTIQIATQADVCVYVCRADYTPKSTFGLFNNLSKEGKLPNACVVLNGIDMSRRKYGYYYGYGAYGKYGKYNRYGYGNYGLYGQYAESHYGLKDDNSIKK